MRSAPRSCRPTKTIFISGPPFLKDNHDQSIPPKFVTFPSKKTMRRRRSSSSSNSTSNTSKNSTGEDDDNDHCDGQSSCRDRGYDCRTTSPSTQKRKHSTSENLPPPPKFQLLRPFFRKDTKHPNKRKKKTLIFEEVNDQYDRNGVLQRTTVIMTKRPDGTTLTQKHKEFISPTNPKYPRNVTTTKKKSVGKAPQQITQEANFTKSPKAFHKKKSIASHHHKERERVDGGRNRRHVPNLK